MTDSRGRVGFPRRITVDLTEEQYAAVRAMRTPDAGVNAIIRALIEIAATYEPLVERARRKAESGEQ